MNQLILNKLRLKNFQGVKDFTLETNGDDIKIAGKNATGKTTIPSACFWLLFGKNIDDRTKFDFQPKTKEGKIIHNIETEVEGVFSFNGKPITLLKTFREKWTKKEVQPKKI